MGMAGMGPKVESDGAGRDKPLWPSVAKDALGSMLVGAFLGYMFLLPFIPFGQAQAVVARLGLNLEPRGMVWLLAAAGGVLGLVLGITSGFVMRTREARRNAGYRQVTASLGAQFAATSDPALAGKLNRFFGSSSSFDARNVVQARSQGIALTVADVHFTESQGSGTDSTTRDVAQTVAYYESDTLHFPRFVLQPEGLMLNLVFGLSGIEGLDFPSHPQFSKAYHLGAVHAENTRKLFNNPLLDALGRRQGLHVASDSNGLVIYRQGKLCEAEALKDLVNVAAEIFRLFEDSARKSGMTKDASPPMKQDVSALVEKPPSLLGRFMREELVTCDDIQAFARQAPPRSIPANILAYREGRAPQMLMGLGIMFAAGGVAFLFGFGSQALYGGHGSFSDNITGMLLGLLFTVVGTPIAFFTARARYRIRRLLRHGRASEGRIEALAPTGISINGATQYLMMVRYGADAREIRGSCKVMGYGAERAEKLNATGKPAVILYDPTDARRILFLGALSSVSPELEE